MKQLLSLLTPNTRVGQSSVTAILLGWVAVLFAYWAVAHPVLLPGPFDVMRAVPQLMADGLQEGIITSLVSNVEAIILSALIALPLAYCSRVPLIAPVAGFLGRLRFLSPSTFFIILLFATKSAGAVKLWMLVLGITFFLASTMITVVQSIPEAQFDDARLLRMSEWKALWYVVVRGTVPQVLDAIRDNAAMGWSMLMMVEGFVRSEGGVGVLLLNQERYFNFAAVYAISGCILLVGLGQDWCLRQLKSLMCPWEAR